MYNRTGSPSRSRRCGRRASRCPPQKRSWLNPRSSASAAARPIWTLCLTISCNECVGAGRNRSIGFDRGRMRVRLYSCLFYRHIGSKQPKAAAAAQRKRRKCSALHPAFVGSGRYGTSFVHISVRAAGIRLASIRPHPPHPGVISIDPPRHLKRSIGPVRAFLFEKRTRLLVDRRKRRRWPIEGPGRCHPNGRTIQRPHR